MQRIVVLSQVNKKEDKKQPKTWTHYLTLNLKTK